MELVHCYITSVCYACSKSACNVYNSHYYGNRRETEVETLVIEKEKKIGTPIAMSLR